MIAVWVTFFLAFLVLAVFLFLPSFLVLRGIGFGSIESICVAPIVSSVVYSVLTVLYPAMGLFTVWWMVVLPLLLLGVVLFVARRFFFNEREGISFGINLDPRIFGICVFMGIVACFILFVAPLGQPEAFVQAWDNAHHQTQVRMFVESGSWSFLDVKLKSDDPGSYYPSLWALFAALAAGATGASAPMAINVVNAVGAALVLPSGLYLFSTALFEGNRRLVLLCGLCGLLFLGFPWQLYTRGAPTLYPNSWGCVFLPSVAALFMLFFGEVCKKIAGEEEKASILPLALLAVMGLVALGLSHPNAVFTLYVILAPFVGWVFGKAVYKKKSRAAVVVFEVLYVAAFLILWVAMTKVSFLQATLTYPYKQYFGPLESIAANLAFWTAHAGSQYALGVVVLVGLAIACIRKEWRWLAVTYIVTFAICVLNAALPDCDLKHLISGFWYNHPPRLQAMKAFAAIPLAAIAIDGVARAFVSLVGKTKLSGKVSEKHAVLLVAAVVVAVVGFVPIPMPNSATLASYYARMADVNNLAGSKSALTVEEKAFLKEVSSVVDPDKGIFNFPNDGSAFVYATDGLNIRHRTFSRYEDDDSMLLKSRFCDIAKDPRVRQAARKANIGYLLLLDNPTKKGATTYTTFSTDEWAGVFSVDEKTPGLKLLLSKDDMRLYQIQM